MIVEKIKLYIGSNNTTKKPDYQKAINTTSKYFKGFNINKNEIGFWEQHQEKCFSITIINKENKDTTTILNLKKELEKELKQFEVLTTTENINLLT